LVLERSENRVALLHDDNGDGVSGDDERVELASAPGLNHGVSVSGGYLYASSDTTVYRWAYDGGREPLGAPEAAVTNLPAGEHATRTVVFDSQGRLYVSVGSQANVDPDSRRARIVRFTPEQLASGATFEDGEVFADGLRNEVGLDFDAQGRLWGVENGLDKLNRTDLGGDIHNDNPGEELNLFAEPGKFYGYPQCWSEFLLPENLGIGPGTQWATPEMDFFDAVQTDAWCRDPANVVPPQLSMQAHSAPLDLKFYTGGSFPNDVIGDVFISFHGSWNRDAATGYKVVRVPMDASGKPEGMPVDVLASDGGNWPHRPVGIGVGKQGQLLVTSDASNVVIAIGHDGT
jgi:glucose/arabinose dehydrogenase